MRGGAGRRGRCYGMYPIDPHLSRVAQRSVPRAFAGVMWGMRVGAATQKHRATLLRRARARFNHAVVRAGIYRCAHARAVIP